MTTNHGKAAAMILNQVGDYQIEEFTVSAQDASWQMVRAMNPSSMGRFTPAGTYMRLMRGGQCVMSNTPDEIHDHSSFIRRARGYVLINGLGIGMCLDAVLAKPEVWNVRVIEIAPEVIQLVGSKYENDLRVCIVQADALEYKPRRGERFDVVWHDIWDDICADNLPDMKALHRKYGRRCEWQGSWARALCERADRDWKRQSRWMR